MGKNGAKKSFFQLIKFGLVGILNTLIDTVISLVLNGVLGWYYPAKIIGYCAGVLNSYLLNSNWTFRAERKKDAREIISFLIVNLVVLGISLGLMKLFRDALLLDAWWMSLGLPAWITGIIDGERACMLLSTVICLIVNFIGNKLIVFRHSGNDKKEMDAVK
ncbi:MAG: GtrA family protein [Clostridia bacterium]|nr:GtrA family protein [Clostridia bacterium]